MRSARPDQSGLALFQSFNPKPVETQARFHFYIVQINHLIHFVAPTILFHLQVKQPLKMKKFP
ncbi:hypothetical protein [Rossellomorea sp. NRS-1567]|uniref:hypothetical protein n=1 Tax=Rossellomorea sp. NRS-1567 TaxID=3233901 RepID=UPI003D277FF6